MKKLESGPAAATVAIPAFGPLRRRKHIDLDWFSPTEACEEQKGSASWVEVGQRVERDPPHPSCRLSRQASQQPWHARIRGKRCRLLGLLRLRRKRRERPAEMHPTAQDMRRATGITPGNLRSWYHGE